MNHGPCDALITESFMTGGVRLRVGQRVGLEWDELLEDGTWVRVPEGTSDPANAGLMLPREALEPIARAIAVHVGEVLPSAAEVRVLREVLAKEQARVDRLLVPSLPMTLEATS